MPSQRIRLVNRELCYVGFGSAWNRSCEVRGMPPPNDSSGSRSAQPAAAPLWNARRKLLALDGGGTRGIVTIAFLERIEAFLAERSGAGAAFRLSDHFDLIGGTSTGAIIAAGLAAGRTVSELKSMYFDLAQRVFRGSWSRVPFIQARFGSQPLAEILRAELGEITLDDPAIRTRLAIVAKRVDTGSPWIISNLPGQPYWDDGPDGKYTGNRHYKLVNVIRASTAAPYFFGPERIPISADVTGSFIDGGISPYNSPTIPLLMLGTMQRYGLSWPVGPENLSMISIGTGSHAVKVREAWSPALKFAAETLGGLIADCQATSLMLMQWLSDPEQAWWLNGDIGSLEGEVLGGQPLLSFQRFDIRLERDWLQEHCGFSASEAELKRLRRMDNPSAMSELYDLARIAGDEHIAAVTTELE